MRFGTIGSGWIVERLVQAGAHCSGFSLDAVYSRSPERAAASAHSLGAAHTYSDLGAFLNSPHIDAVYIASPNSLHCEQSLAAMRCGKHVLCEKSAASNARELETMLRTARECGVLFLEASRHVHAPYTETLRAALPLLGDIRRVSLVYNQYSSRYDKFKDGVVANTFDPAFSGGALMDLGVYCVQLLVWLFGEPERICARAVHLANGLDGQGCILAEYAGMLAELSYSKISDAPVPSVIQGEDAALVFDPMAAPDRIQIIPRRGAVQELAFERRENDMQFEVEHFLALADDPAALESYHRCSLTSLRLMDEARRQLGIAFPADLS